MPVTQISFDPTELSLRYKEPYVSAGINAKLAVNTPPGIYRGFKINVSGLNNELVIQSDTTEDDHVAVYETGRGFPGDRHSVTIRRATGDFLLTLDPVIYPAGTEVILALAASYVLGADTTAELRTYSRAEWDASFDTRELLVLGTVFQPTPVANPITSYSHARRSMAWLSQSPDAIPWVPVLKNTGFEFMGGVGRHRFENWEILTETNCAFAQFSAGHTGTWSLQLNASTTSTTADMRQLVEAPVLASTTKVLVRAWIQVSRTPLVSALTRLQLEWGTPGTGNLFSTTNIPLVTVGASDGGNWRLVEAVVQAPAGVGVLKAVVISCALQSWSGTGSLFLLDDVQVYVEKATALEAPATDHTKVSATSLLLEDPVTLAMGQLAALLRFDKTTLAPEGKVVLERKDQVAASAPPILELVGRLLLGTNLGATEANALKARVTSPTSVAGGTTEFTLQWESLGGTYPARLYTGASGRWLLTINCFWGGTTWSRDAAGDAVKLELLNGSFRVFRRATTATPWTDADTGGIGSAGWEVDLFSASGTTLSGSLTARGGIGAIGNELTNVSADAQVIPRLSFTAPGGLYLAKAVMAWFQGTLNTELVSDHAGVLHFVINAELLNTGNWKKSLAEPAFRLSMASTGLTLASRAGGISGDNVGGFAEGSWVTVVSFDTSTALVTPAKNTRMTWPITAVLAEALASKIEVAAAASGTSAWTLVMEGQGSGTLASARYYVGDSGSWMWTTNAKWDGSNWSCENTANPATGVRGTVTGMFTLAHAATAGTWADGSWSYVATLGTSSRETDLLDGRIRFTTPSTNTNPAYNYFGTHPNAVYGKNIVKAWGLISVLSGAPGVTDGFNIASMARPTDDALEVTFTTGFSSSPQGLIGFVSAPDYMGQLTGALWQTGANTARVALWNNNHPTPIQWNFRTLDVKLHFVVLGTQGA
jgi:hypothetical protein